MTATMEATTIDVVVDDDKLTHLCCPIQVEKAQPPYTCICGAIRRDAIHRGYPLCLVCEALSASPCTYCGGSHLIHGEMTQ